MSGVVANSVDSKSANVTIAASAGEICSESQTQTRHTEAETGNGWWKARRVRQWKSPLVMIVFFIIGMAMSVGHCIFYPRLDGVIVGSSNNQEKNIR
jgi:hypothetical protein